jgi:putative ABC transport system permease protein
MLKNFFTIARRNLMKNKTYAAINIFGLSIGLACCMLIVCYLRHELLYDSHQSRTGRLFQVGTTFITDGKEDRFPAVPAVMAQNMKQDFPEIEQTARLLVFSFFGDSRTLLRCIDPDGTVHSFYESKGCAADPSFFRLFDYHFVEGNISTALHEPNSVVISKEIAGKIFGNKPALHKLIHISNNLNGEHDCLVSGVFVPGDEPSHIDARFFISLYGGSIEERMKRDGNNMTFDNLYTTYLLLKGGADARKLEAKFPAFTEKYAGKDLKQAGFYRKEFLLPVEDIHLHAAMMEMTPSGSATYLYVLASVAVFVLLTACVNFMNLSTAASSRRLTEVGIRKLLGATKNSLIKQFLGESVLMSLIAFVFAMILLGLMLPVFEKLSGKNLALFTQANRPMPIFFLLIALVTGLVAGSYPAFYLSSFRPASVLKGRLPHSPGSLPLRKGLVIFQFVIAIILIISTAVISDQMQFLRTADLGFAKDRQIVIPLQSELSRSIYPAFKNELLRQRTVVSVGASAYYPGISNAGSDNFHKEGQDVSAGQLLRLNHVDSDFLKTLRISLVAGRSFSASFFAVDTNNHVVLNEEAVRKIGFASPRDAIGKKIYDVYKGHGDTSEIIGVVKDFHFEDLHTPIAPYGFYLNGSNHFNYALVHAGPGDLNELLQSMERSWHKLDPDQPFVYSFLDDDFQLNYADDNRLSGLVNYFALVAILISCSGLFGLSTFSATQRSKEISIRKVLGAGVGGMVLLLVKDYLRLVITSVFIASPIALFLTSKWLEDFSPRIRIGWGAFVLSAVLVTTLAFITISFQTIRAATANPVKNLKNE